MERSFTTTVLVGAAMLAVSPMAARAATCDQFKAAMAEGAAMYHAPAPKFEVGGPSPPEVQFLQITIFDDAHSVMSCWHGEVGSFIASTDNSEPKSVLHTGLLAGMGLHAFGMAWPEALETRDHLVGLAKVSVRNRAEVSFDGGKVDLVISLAGVPSYEIETDDPDVPSVAR
jgi:hypothetical protein